MPRINSDETLDVRGNLVLTSAKTLDFKANSIGQSVLNELPLEVHAVPLTDLRVWDAVSSGLPSAATADDLGLINGTFGTDAATVQTSDGKATTITQYARFFYTLPSHYKDGQDVSVRINAGMITTVSDGTATVDVECYANDDDGSIGSDLCVTSAQSINTTVDTKANKDFVITPTSLISGDTLDIRITVSITDTGTTDPVIGELSQVAMLLDVTV